MALTFLVSLDPAPASFAEARVVRLRGVEAMNRPSRFEIDLEIPTFNEGREGLSDLMQRDVGIHMRWVDDQGQPAPFERSVVRAGVITSIAYLGLLARGESKLRIVVEDRLALAGIGRRTRAHVEQSFADIATEIANRVQADLQMDSSPAIARIIQWQETDLDFMTRLLAHHGGFYYTRPGAESGDQQVIAGATPSAYGAAGDALSAHFITHTDSGDHHGVRNFSRREGLMPHKIHYREHLSTQSEFYAEKTYALPSGRYAQLQVDAIESIHRTPSLPKCLPAAEKLSMAQWSNNLHFHGDSTYASLHAGRCLKLPVDWPEALDEYLILSITHDVTSGENGMTYVNHFTACEYSVQWHAWPLPERPRIEGMHLAVVTSNDVPADDASFEGSSLEQGVYEVQFPSERDWDGTPLVQRARFAQPAAGSDRGLHIPPEVGDEVVVVHVNGDPDRPVIVGTLYSQNALGPRVAVQDGTTVSSVLRSRTGHELRFDDASGSEKISLTSGTGDHGLVWDDANKNMSLGTQGDLKEAVKGDHSTSVQGNQSNAVTGDRTISVTGNQQTGVTGNREAAVTGDDKAEVTGAWNVVATGRATIQSADGAAMAAPQVRLESSGQTRLKDGGTTITLDSSSVAINATSITLTGTASITLTVGGSSVTIDAAGVTINGPNVTASGSAGATLSSSAAVTITGASVGING